MMLKPGTALVAPSPAEAELVARGSGGVEFVAGGVFGTELVGSVGGKFVKGGLAGVFVIARAPFPAASQVARPSTTLNAIPLTVRPPRFTVSAGTSNRVHCPAAGKAPM